MKYIGMDVHTKATVWCCLDETGKVIARGKVPTTAPEVTQLVTEVGGTDALYGQEAGKMSYFVHDVLAATGARVLTFNAELRKNEAGFGGGEQQATEPARVQ